MPKMDAYTKDFQAPIRCYVNEWPEDILVENHVNKSL